LWAKWAESQVGYGVVGKSDWFCEIRIKKVKHVLTAEKTGKGDRPLMLFERFFLDAVI